MSVFTPVIALIMTVIIAIRIDTRDKPQPSVINIICNNPDLAENILSQEGYSVSRKYVIGVLMEDRPGAMAAITEYLHTKNINITNAYGFILKRERGPC